MSMLIGLYVHKALLQSEDIQRLTSGKVAPVVFTEDGDIQAPYIYFSRTATSESDSKDGLFGHNSTVAIDIVGRTYEEMMLLAQSAYDALHMDFRHRRGDWSDMPFVVTDLTVSAGAEDFDPATLDYTTQLIAEFSTEPNPSYNPEM